MNRAYLLISSVLVAVSCVAVEKPAPPGGPKIEVSTTAIDLGEVKPVDGAEYAVEIRNAGTEPLEISQIAPLCTCVDVNATALTVAPGALERLTILTMLSTYPANDVKGKVRLLTNDPERPEVHVALTGRITPEYVIEPAKIEFGEMDAGDSAEATFVIRTTGAKSLRIKRVEASKGLAATLKEPAKRRTPSGGGEAIVQEEQRSHEIFVTLASDVPPGAFNGIVTVFTDCARLSRAEVKITAQIAGLVYTVTPKVLAFGNASPGEALGTFTVHGEGIRVVEARADKPGLVLMTEEVDPGRTYRVQAVADTGSGTGVLLRVISIRIAGGTLEEETRVRVYGRLK